MQDQKDQGNVPKSYKAKLVFVRTIAGWFKVEFCLKNHLDSKVNGLDLAFKKLNMYIFLLGLGHILSLS